MTMAERCADRLEALFQGGDKRLDCGGKGHGSAGHVLMGGLVGLLEGSQELALRYW